MAARKPCRRPKVGPPCAVLDEMGPRKGYKVALFDPRTDELESFLVSGADGCGTTRRRTDATTFRTMAEVEAALNRCGALPCPP